LSSKPVRAALDANAVVDALWHLGVRTIDIPITPVKVWQILREKGVKE
jgi:carbon-monoxide dehydrogenase large subunit